MVDLPVVRRGNADDSYAVMAITEYAMTELSRQWGVVAPSEPFPDKTALDATWERTRQLYDFLSANADEWWVAEQYGRVVAFARSILCDGVRELTELFAHPQVQGTGLGRQLLSKAFPTEGARHRTIMSTIDPAAQMLYMGSGVFPRFPIRGFSRVPETVRIESDLLFTPAADDQPAVDSIGAIDAAVLGFRRSKVHRWLLATRGGFLCYRGDEVVGYGYVGRTGGPFAALERSDLPAILAHAESSASEQGLSSFYVLVPLINEAAVGYVTRRRYEMDRIVLELMIDEPFGCFDCYVAGSPFFL
ncbi:MAG: N-acetyltransferase [Spirochaetaceae bacterium]|nr:MAG: N-acetyltransferase [Spirochaetaceae bacterium]